MTGTQREELAAEDSDAVSGDGIAAPVAPVELVLVDRSPVSVFLVCGAVSGPRYAVVRRGTTAEVIVERLSAILAAA